MRKPLQHQKTRFQLATVMAVTSGMALLLTMVGAGTAGAATVGASHAGAKSALGTQATAAVSGAGSDYFPVTPVRICDTRAESAGVSANQCDAQGAAPLGPGGVANVTVIGTFGTAMVPADATAVVLHVTATDTTGVSYFTVWPTFTPQPVASSLNWNPDENISNTIQAAVGQTGQVSVYNNQGSADLVIDLEGYYEVATGGLVNTVAPVRVCDTRKSKTIPANQCNNNGTKAGTMQPNSMMSVSVASGFGVPMGATAVVVNVTATNTTSDGGYLTVWADGTTRPFASDLNWAAGQEIADRVITPISSAGVFDVYNAVGTTNVVIDLDGYVTASGGAQYFPVPPERICDTRAQGPGVAANPCNDAGPGTLGPVGSNSDSRDFTESTPSAGLALNVTVTNTTGGGYLTVYPDSETTPPNASDLNWTAGTTIANLAVTAVGSMKNGFIMFNGSTGNVDVVVDMVGYYQTLAPSSL
ncbi:MAG: hypothetical protein ACRDZ8_10875 [Acidimicrobiales bacterium]